jgi:hypothetical protein
MCKVIKAMQIVPILSAANSRKGTQLKLHLLVEGDQTVFFKPSWYSRNRVIDGPVFSGKDRHNSEIMVYSNIISQRKFSNLISLFLGILLRSNFEFSINSNSCRPSTQYEGSMENFRQRIKKYNVYKQ